MRLASSGTYTQDYGPCFFPPATSTNNWHAAPRSMIFPKLDRGAQQRQSAMMVSHDEIHVMDGMHALKLNKIIDNLTSTNITARTEKIAHEIFVPTQLADHFDIRDIVLSSMESATAEWIYLGGYYFAQKASVAGTNPGTKSKPKPYLLTGKLVFFFFFFFPPFGELILNMDDFCG